MNAKVIWRLNYKIHFPFLSLSMRVWFENLPRVLNGQFLGNKRHNFKMILIRQKKIQKFFSHEVNVLCCFHLVKITCGFAMCYTSCMLPNSHYWFFIHSHFCSCIPNRQLCVNIKCNLQITSTTKTIQCSKCTQTCCYVHFLNNR